MLDSLLKSIASKVRGAAENAPAPEIKAPADPAVSAVEAQWAELKERKRRLSEEVRQAGPTTRLSAPIQPLDGHLEKSAADLFRHQVQAEPYWFQKIELMPGVLSPGWSDPRTEKLPYFGLPEDLTGMRVLDIGCAEGFFSFEAERRGAREVIGIDSFPDSVRRFNIVKAARQSNATAFLMNVYDLEPKRLGTFDLVLFYGVFYHLKHPQFALERIRSICSGNLLFQTHIYEEPAVKGIPWARFYPHGYMSGAKNELWDPTVFWLFNSACCLAMLDHVGFTDLKILSTDPNPFVISAKSPERSIGVPPDQTEAPWC
jgi:tRNA (mo5U34)-methyltransferase